MVLAPSGCGYSYVRDYCPGCVVFERGVEAPAVPAGTRTLFVLVPGMLGYGWEWDAPRSLLAQVPSSVTQVYGWPMWSSLGRVAGDFAEHLNRILARLPGSVRQVIIIGHSAGGLVTAFASSQLEVPAGCRVLIANVGAPYAGMHTTPDDNPPNQIWTPFPFTMGGRLTRYPLPARGVTVESWVTGWPADPVMRPRFGHRPDDPRVGPPGERHAVPPGIDHNRVLEVVVRTLVGRTEGEKTGKVLPPR